MFGFKYHTIFLFFLSQEVLNHYLNAITKPKEAHADEKRFIYMLCSYVFPYHQSQIPDWFSVPAMTGDTDSTAQWVLQYHDTRHACILFNSTWIPVISAGIRVCTVLPPRPGSKITLIRKGGKTSPPYISPGQVAIIIHCLCTTETNVSRSHLLPLQTNEVDSADCTTALAHWSRRKNARRIIMKLCSYICTSVMIVSAVLYLRNLWCADNSLCTNWFRDGRDDKLFQTASMSFTSRAAGVTKCKLGLPITVWVEISRISAMKYWSTICKDQQITS